MVSKSVWIVALMVSKSNRMAEAGADNYMDSSVAAVADNLRNQIITWILVV